jgi:hypothetical protein
LTVLKKRLLKATVNVSGYPIGITVSRSPVWAIAGFKSAVTRFRAAEAAGGVDDAHHAVFEALSWLDSLSSAKKSLVGDVTVKGLLFARARSHHHLASVIELSEGTDTWLWRRASVLPHDESYKNEAGERAYEKVLSGKPVAVALTAAERAIERTFTSS